MTTTYETVTADHLLDTLLAYAKTRPCIRTYNCATTRNYRKDVRMATNVLGEIRALHFRAKEEGVTAEDIVSTAQGERLSWDGSQWNYCYGKHDFLELRRDAKRLLEQSIAHHRHATAASVPVPEFHTLEDVRQYHKQTGKSFFEPDRVRYFNAIFHTKTLIHGRYFIESTQSHEDRPRYYRVLEVTLETGDIKALDLNPSFLSLEEALASVPSS